MKVGTQEKLVKQIVGISDMKVSNKPTECIITYSLGSCIAVVAYDYKLHLAGMIHVMLPDSNIEKLSKTSIAFNPYKYMDTGLPVMLKKMRQRGAENKSTIISAFGGAQVFDREDYFNIGKRNYVSMRKVLWQQGLLIKNEHVGGKVHRTVKIDVASGEITLDVNKEQIITYSSNK